MITNEDSSSFSFTPLSALIHHILITAGKDFTRGFFRDVFYFPVRLCAIYFSSAGLFHGGAGELQNGAPEFKGADTDAPFRSDAVVFHDKT